MTVCGIEKKGIKGNSGKARRNRELKRFGIVLATCVIVILIHEVFNAGEESNSNQRHGHYHQRGEHALRQSGRDYKLPTINYQALSKEEQTNLVVRGKAHLIDVKISRSGIQNVDSYHGVIGVFCQLDWSLHKSDPSSYPMFRDLVAQSPSCRNPFELDLKQVINIIRKDEEDSTNSNTSHTLYPTGFVFHESRCGSTLVANSLAAMNPSRHRVYSESSPPIEALRACGFEGEECPEGRSVELFRDVIHVMGRTESVDEKHLFFKIQSIGSRYLPVFLEAFPDTPWVYVYREPVQIMMSQLANGEDRANCVRQLRDVPRSRIDKLLEVGKEVHDLSSVEKCALHLSLLCESATRALFESGMLGRPVNYENIVQKLIQHIIPDHFGVLMTDAEKDNILQVASKYSKGRGGKKREWNEDSNQKEMRASKGIRHAAEYFLKEWYDIMEEQSQNEYYGEGAHDLSV
mmetsp:Transcript_2255/g.4160  ORF Transcript_2255/g.4160 Transcript_2255/m.4160 type:complete len:462 (+) Transcript_2255:199-1584(+)|eukprot:CAMPEP_0176477532 /NCGR_PEP_ID=MMETSP0200_2-20121128/676_1 /TAXON_ID=947934 /ORGANISM="Chaetoceros sp., Strain GSL56" /LENGTH=461 /DNA_ID=CAMNT_0017873355 /DNA_START=172 /DNA_END=1557 /DNA_ORIENTATION=-